MLRTLETSTIIGITEDATQFYIIKYTYNNFYRVGAKFDAAQQLGIISQSQYRTYKWTFQIKT